jgi:chromosome segregation ATPase
VWITRLGPILNRPAWTIADVVAWATPWRDALIREAGLQDATAIAPVPSHLVDAAPFNLVHANGQFRFFDLEWEPTFGVEYGYALFRGLFWSLARFHSVAEPAEGVPLGVATLSSALAAALGAAITPSDETRYLDIEAELQHQVGSVATVKAREDLSARRLRARSSLESLAGLTGQLESLKEVNRQIEVARDELRDELQRHQAAPRHSIERGEAEREALQRQLAEATHAREELEMARQATEAQLDASETARRLTTAQLDAATAELATAQAETDRARHQLTEAREGLEAARQEIEAQLDASETARRLMTAELEAATAELATARAETDRARRQLTETREELEAARQATEARLDASETARCLTTAQLEAATAELATAKAQTDLARGELAKTREEVQGLSEQIQAAERLAHEQSRRIRAGQRALRLTRMEAEERGRQVRHAAALAVSGDDPGAVRASIVTRALQRLRQAQLSRDGACAARGPSHGVWHG